MRDTENAYVRSWALLFATLVGTIGLSYLFNRKSKPHYNVCITLINLENESEEVLVRSGHKSNCTF